MDHFLPPLLINKCIFFLKDIGGLSITCLMEQGWLSDAELGLVDYQDVSCWNGYLAILKASHVRLNNVADVLIWN